MHEQYERSKERLREIAEDAECPVLKHAALSLLEGADVTDAINGEAGILSPAPGDRRPR